MLALLLLQLLMGALSLRQPARLPSSQSGGGKCSQENCRATNQRSEPVSRRDGERLTGKTDGRTDIRLATVVVAVIERAIGCQQLSEISRAKHCSQTTAQSPPPLTDDCLYAVQIFAKARIPRGQLFPRNMFEPATCRQRRQLFRNKSLKCWRLATRKLATSR